ncbi:hypothetical protein B0A53_01770 [Rhodotorula sp. CCFEE 5036]|nr:hypothetical protein B0A53_01770 [Rhodotorula sp. CCFEE 5036]
MARAKAETATKAKTRSSKHPSKTFRKVIAPVVPEDSEGSGASSSPEDDASGAEDAADDSSSDETDGSKDSNECGDQCSAACLAKAARLRRDVARKFEGCELDKPFAWRWAHLPDLPPIPARYWLEYLVPSVLGSVYKRDSLPRVAVCYLQSNKVLGAVAFAYCFGDDGVARPPHKQLHYYADMFEAFIENVFEDDPSTGTEWLKALWSSQCFPDLQSYIKEHSSSKGAPYGYSDLSRARAWWQKKRQKALSWKPRPRPV